MNQKKYQCPCCGFYTLEELGGGDGVNRTCRHGTCRANLRLTSTGGACEKSIFRNHLSDSGSHIQGVYDLLL